jgi:hypothetical protein
LARKEPRLMRYYTKLLRAMAHTKPIHTTIDVYQQLQQMYAIPLIVWTNTDLDLFVMKYKDCNYRRASKQLQTLMLDGYFCVGQPTDKELVPQCTDVKKPHPDFYTKAVAYSKQVVGDTDGSWLYLYIDDKAQHVNAARAYAAQTSAPIIAIQYTTWQQLSADLEYLLTVFVSA